MEPQAQSVGLGRARGVDSQSLGLPSVTAGTLHPVPSTAVPQPELGLAKLLGKVALLHQLPQPLPGCPPPTAGVRPPAHAFAGWMINPLC